MTTRFLSASLLFVPAVAAAQSISSSGALGERLLLVPLIMAAIIAAPAMLIYAVAARLLFKRWPRWSMLLPPLVALPLAVGSILLLLDDAMFLGALLPIFGEGALVALLMVVGLWRHRAKAPPA